MPHISVIMPCLNVVKYIDKCICSVVTQTEKDIEIIVVDAGSTDGTLEVISTFAEKDSRITLIHSDKRSYGYQMNLGISVAQGEYVSIVETDDYIEQDMLEVLYNEAKRSGADYVKGTSEGFFQCEGFEWRYVILPFEELKNNQRVEVNPKEQPKTFLEDNFLWNGIYRKDILKKIHFNETFGAAFQDIGALFRIFTTASKGVYLQHKVYNYRQDNSGASSYNKKSLQFTCFEYEQIKPLLNQLPKEWTEIYYNKLAGLTLNRFIFMGGSGEYWGESSEGIIRIQNEIQRSIDQNVHFDLSDRYEIQLFCENPYCLYEYEKKRYEDMKRRLKFIMNKAHEKEIYICGSGRYGQFMHAFLDTHGVKSVCAFGDNNSKIVGSLVQNIPVESIEEIAKKKENSLYIIATKTVYAIEIENQLINLGILSEQIIKYSEGTDVYLLKEKM